MVFAGVGLVALPLDLFREFMGRPRATITHSEYIKRARGLGVRAKGIKVGWGFLFRARTGTNMGINEGFKVFGHE